MGQCYVSSVAARAMQAVRVLPEIVAQDERHEQANRVISMAWRVGSNDSGHSRRRAARGAAPCECRRAAATPES